MTSTRDTLQALRRGDLSGAWELRLTGPIAEFPREILGLGDSLEVLDLSGCGLSDLPADLGRLRKLRVLFCSGNRFETLPPVLGDCPTLSQIGFRGVGLRTVPGEALPSALRWLTLTDNRIEVLPREIGERPLLQKLMLAGNQLRALPESLTGASGLELIRLSANRFDALPPWLARLPSLAWLAWAGNPCEPALPTATVRPVPWTEIEPGALLGEGASGQVLGALWRRPGAGPAQPVALKLFKGAMTSDGLPEREMAACLAAGAHPNLTGALGAVSGHPEGRAGLLMPRMPAHWGVLAGPPSLSSCSRDVYAAALRIAPAVVLRIAEAVAGAAAHLHGAGLLHGDLYAHNVLWDGVEGTAMLSDFGAASALPPGAEGGDLERLDVRAWGLLVEELLAVCEPDALSDLHDLARSCIQPEIRDRPPMHAVRDALSVLDSARG